MKINHNMSAVVANNQLLRNESGLTRSLERLSSGLKINHASDDAAGMAISTKMKAQIKGLDQASRNASDGISVLDTADGALGEVSDMIQRMRELSVQAANETNTKEDLKAIQSEISSLTAEVDRVSKDTEFNTKSLLDGTLDRRVYSDSGSVRRIQISDSVQSLKNGYKLEIERDARQAVGVGNGVISTPIPAGSISINGSEITIEAGESLDSVYEKLREGAEYGGVNLIAISGGDPVAIDGTDTDTAGYNPSIFTPGNKLALISNEYGSSAEINIKCDNPALAASLGLSTSATINGCDPIINLQNFPPTATVSYEGSYIKITDVGGFEMSFEAPLGTCPTVYTDAIIGSGTRPVYDTSTIKEINFDVTDIGTLTLQIGANKDQTVDVRIPSISAENLYIDKVNVSVIGGADKAIVSYDKAIAKVSESRSRIGAYQNRLDYTVASLDLASENITAAQSRIEDVDMAKEMSEYTKFNVLTQAATSVLAQANDIPQQTLQLLK